MLTKYLTRIPMAFARASNHLDGDELDLGELLVPHPERSVLYRVPGDALAPLGILSGDMIVVERGRAPRAGEFALLTIDGSTALRRFIRDRGRPTVGGFPPVGEDREVSLHGTATLLVRPLT
jgi:SOS-response transcriptional repressor LexA